MKTEYVWLVDFNFCGGEIVFEDKLLAIDCAEKIIIKESKSKYPDTVGVGMDGRYTDSVMLFNHEFCGYVKKRKIHDAKSIFDDKDIKNIFWSK